VQFYTMAKVAKMLSVSTRSIHRLIKKGDLPVRRFGDSVRIAHADLMAFIATH
jgi:excisionase family DNA binding protein